ncbi:MAG: GatB/YqeY domain-containing protein [Clostridia bacterium]|nr:GatB/YqeY domain-containing protein [Clostridia bacterium]
MSKIEQVRSEMMNALKAKDTERKNALSLLLAALKAKEKDKREPLTEDEENMVISKEIKQTKETMESAPEDRVDIIEQCKFKISVMQEFAPKSLSEEEITEIIKSVIEDLGLDNPGIKEKGLIMKNLMPKVSGKADGGIVNQIVSNILTK